MNRKVIAITVAIPLIVEYALGALSHYSVWAALPALGIAGFLAISIASIKIDDLHRHK